MAIKPIDKPIDSIKQELLPCPFCGGQPHYSDGDNAHIICLNGDCSVFDITHKSSFNDFNQLVIEWNTRDGKPRQASQGGK